ncbi:MAG: DUF1353 domain-containing protein [Balneolaceae bacterium]
MAKRKKLWKFKLDKDLTLEREYDFLSFDKVESFIFPWATIVVSKNKIRVIAHEGYAWDGCTPKFHLKNIIVGVWDGPILYATKLPQAYLASLIHDILCQYMGKHAISRKQADQIFYAMLKEVDFLFAPLYYAAVRFFGMFFARRK